MRKLNTQDHRRPTTTDLQLASVARVYKSAVCTGRYAFCALVVLCCLSCSPESGAPQLDQAAGETAASVSENAASQPTSQQSSGDDVPGHSETIASHSVTNEVNSTPEGSAKKAVAPTVQAGQPQDVNANETTVLTTSSGQEWVEEVQRDMNPANDGWDSELFAERAGKQLKHLGEFLVRDDPPTADELAHLLATDFSSTQLRPAERQQVFADMSVTVERPQQHVQDPTYQGAEGLSSALEDLTAGLEKASDKHFKFKLFRITPSDQQIETTSYFELSGRNASGAIQRSSTWRCRWEPSAPEREPRLLSIRVDDYEEVIVRNTNQTLFSDCTESIFRESRAYSEQFRRGIDYWRARLESYLNIFYDGHRGLAIGDVNGDGLDDLYLCEPGGLPNRLFLQKADGLLRDASAQSGIDFFDSTRNAIFVDLDNDGDQDLVMPMERQIHFFSNDGKGHFTRKAKLPFQGQTAFSLAAADYDQDGHIDIYACFYHGLGVKESNRQPAPIPYHDARSGGLNRLLRNEGKWQFRDVTSEVGLDHNNDRWSYAAVWEDYDNDGDLDLYVANDFGRNNLYRQQGGQFEDVAGPAGAEDMNFGMSASFGDYNRDGLMDIYISNMFSSAGGRITFQPGFQTEGSDELIAVYQRMAAGNTLLRNVGDGTFRDVSSQAHVGVGRWAWGSIFADINNDGWEDILVANGFVTGHLPGDL